jgi:hypothetical protein
MKRSTYNLQRAKKHPMIAFSAEPKSPKLTVSNEGVALRWKADCTVPLGRLSDLVEWLICEDLVVTIEPLQPDMWHH